jgi:Right handed beta helix region
MKCRFVGGHRSGVARRPECVAEALEERLALAVFTVGNANDMGGGSLRQAILDANNLTGQDTIVFATPFFASPRTISLLSPLPQMSDKLTVTGPGASLLTVRRDSSVMSTFGVLNSTATVLNLSGMTVTGGITNGNGGGLASTGPGGPNVTLDGMVFTGNNATGLGGGVYLNNGTTLTVRDSTFTGNTAGGGGGLYFFSGGALVMERCTVSGNTATETTSQGGGGIYFAGTVSATPPAGFTPSTLLVRNSTISQNTTARAGAGIMVQTMTGTLLVQNSTINGNTAATLGGGIGGVGGPGGITLQNCTISANKVTGTTAGTGGGGVGRTSTVANNLTIVNSVVSGNTATNGADILVDPFTTTTANYSAIGNSGGFTLSGSSGNNLAFGTNLMLAALANNGGPTLTMMPQAGSPLLNHGSNASVPPELVTDQRGLARISGGVVDIGAVEREVTGPAVLSAQFVYLTPPQSLRFTFSENVGASLGLGDLVLSNLTTGTTVPAANMVLVYQAASNLATYSFPGYAAGVLPDANYRAKLVAAGITNSSGTPMAADYTYDFFVLGADANRDRKVDFSDLVVLAQNYGTTGKTFAQGNFSYDAGGAVSFEDLVILAQRYNKTLPAAGEAIAAESTAPVFNSVVSVRRPAVAKRPSFSQPQ